MYYEILKENYLQKYVRFIGKSTYIDAEIRLCAAGRGLGDVLFL